MSKLAHCLQKLREFNQLDYSIGLAQDIADAESEVRELVFIANAYVTDNGFGRIQPYILDELLAEFGGD